MSRPDWSIGGITIADSEQVVPEDIVSLWHGFAGLSADQRQQFQQAASLYQLALMLFGKFRTASFAFMVAACEALKPGGGEFKEHNAYDVVEALLDSYEADVYWPKPLPNRWVLGGLGGVCVDAQDHVFILNRQDVLEGELNTGRLAPPIIEFDSAGNVVNSWGDPKLLDPRLHSCHVDRDNNIWIASAPSGMVQKYTHNGSTLLLQIGKKGVVDSSDGTVKGKPLNSNAAIFFMPSSISVDRQNGDIYVSDGEGAGSNRRIAVIDSSGKFLRQWQPDGMETVHCMALGNDGLVYICNRNGSRIQVYDKMGTLKRTIHVPWTPVTPPSDGTLRQFGGSVVAIDFSPDQNLIFVINQNNAQIEIVDRESGKIIGNFGRSGSFPGQFNQPHGIAVDSKGNIYIAENRGRRIHKFKIAHESTGVRR